MRLSFFKPKLFIDALADPPIRFGRVFSNTGLDDSNPFGSGGWTNDGATTNINISMTPIRMRLTDVAVDELYEVWFRWDTNAAAAAFAKTFTGVRCDIVGVIATPDVTDSAMIYSYFMLIHVTGLEPDIACTSSTNAKGSVKIYVWKILNPPATLQRYSCFAPLNQLKKGPERIGYHDQHHTCVEIDTDDYSTSEDEKDPRDDMINRLLAIVTGVVDPLASNAPKRKDPYDISPEARRNVWNESKVFKSVQGMDERIAAREAAMTDDQIVERARMIQSVRDRVKLDIKAERIADDAEKKCVCARSPDVFCTALVHKETKQY